MAWTEQCKIDFRQQVEHRKKQGQKIKARLAADGLIEEHEELTKYGRIRLIRLTENGVRFLQNNENAA